jgi:membrane-bound lytic murein transglycosylase A
VRIEFAGKNGRAYRGVADVIRSLGGLKEKGSGTMQGIRAWFKANPQLLDQVLDQIASMIFFKVSTDPGAMGSQGVVLTAGRSVATDRNFVALGTPLWIDTRVPIPRSTGARDWRHLVVAQDTGGGIKGAVRADIFWGEDADAEELGGRMGGKGRYWLLLPRTLKVR